VMAYLAGGWKVMGFSIFVTRSLMLLVAAFSLLGVFRLARRAANFQVAIAATVCTALYPVFFAQSTMAHVDLAAAGLTLWGLEAYLGERRPATVVWFSLAVLAKETAVLAPLTLLAWEVSCPWIARLFQLQLCLSERRRRFSKALLMPVAALSAWYAFHYWRTGYVFGNPEFFRYNVQSTMSPLRMVLALGMRLWQVFGYMHLWVLMILMIWAMTRPATVDGNHERQRIDISVQCVFGVLILGYVVAMAVVGGAVLARYMLPVVPLVIIVAVSTLWRRVRRWPVLIAAVSKSAIWFLAGGQSRLSRLRRDAPGRGVRAGNALSGGSGLDCLAGLR